MLYELFKQHRKCFKAQINVKLRASGTLNFKTDFYFVPV